MNYTRPPGFDELQIMVRQLLLTLPDELMEYVEDVVIQIEEFPDDAVQQEFEIDNVFDFPVLFRSGKEISPGVEKKNARDDDQLIVYRRPVLDVWCESHEDLSVLVRQLIIEELGRVFNFSEDDVEDMIARHYQGLLYAS
jgi:predicted Zn-dependent protease with MMP-like domain